MNSYDYKEAFRHIKPSNELNNRVIDNLMGNSAKKKVIHHRYKIAIAAFCVALISISGITVAASGWNLADIFKGFFKESANDSSELKETVDSTSTDKQQTIPVSNDSPFLHTAGAVIESTDTQAGLKLTAKGVVGDDRAVYVAIDVETTNGGAFTKQQEENLNAIHFQQVKLQIDDDVLGQYCNCIRIDDGTIEGKATFLVQDIIKSDKIEDISGHQLTITLSNFLHTTNELEDIGMTGNLYDLFTQFDQPDDEDYTYYQLRNNPDNTKEEDKKLKEYTDERRKDLLKGEELKKCKEELIEEGILEPLYTLPQTSKQISFCTKYPKLVMTNMGIKNNLFTFNIALNDELDYQYLTTKDLTLVNRKTGACVRAVMDIDQWEGDEDGKLISAHFIVFHTITDAEQLKDYYLAIGGYGAEDIVNKGKWKLNFKLDYKDTSRKYDLNQKATIAGVTGSIQKVDISPLSMKIIFQIDELMSGGKQIFDDRTWVENENKIYISMKNGTKINCYSVDEDIQDNLGTFHIMFPNIIDLEQVDKIVIDQTEIPIN